MTAPSPRTFLFAWIAWISCEFFVLGKYSYAMFADSSELYMHLAAPGGFGARWMPWMLGGVDAATTGSYSLLASGLFHLLPAMLAYQVIMAALMVLGSWAMFQLVRRQLGPGEDVAALLATMVYGSVLVVYPHLAYGGIGLLPLGLLAVTAVLDRPRSPGRWAGLVAASLVCVSIPFPSNMHFFPLALMAWFVVVDRRKGWQSWLIILAAAATPLVRLPETLALAGNVHDSAFYYTRFGIGAAGVPMFDLLMTWETGDGSFLLVGLALLGGLTLTRRGAPRVLLALALLAVAAILPFQSPTYFGPISALIQSFIPKKLFLLLALPFLVIAAGHGLGWVLRRGGGRWRKAVIAVVAVLTLGETARVKFHDLSEDWLSNGSLVRTQESPVVADLLAALRQDPWPARVAPLFVYSAYLNGLGIETIDGNAPVIHRPFFEFWSAAMEPWIERQGGPEQVWPAQTPLLRRDDGWPRYRSERLTFTPTDSIAILGSPLRPMEQFYRMNLLSLANVRYFLSRERLSGPNLVELSRPDKAWYELSLREKILTALRENFSGRRTLFLYRNDAALPRFFTVRQIAMFEAGRPLVEAMAAAPVERLRDTGFIRRGPLAERLTAAQPLAEGTISLTRYSPDQIDLQVKGDGPMLLVVTNAYSPGWTVTINGHPGEIVPIDHTFWGVELPGGNNNVHFSYAGSTLATILNRL